jgi:hypothetical protein
MDFCAFEYHFDLFGMGSYSIIRSDERVYIIHWDTLRSYEGKE